MLALGAAQNAHGTVVRQMHFRVHCEDWLAQVVAFQLIRMVILACRLSVLHRYRLKIAAEPYQSMLAKVALINVCH